MGLESELKDNDSNMTHFKPDFSVDCSFSFDFYTFVPSAQRKLFSTMAFVNICLTYIHLHLVNLSKYRSIVHILFFFFKGKLLTIDSFFFFLIILAVLGLH